jgi:hypothetical protein
LQRTANYLLTLCLNPGGKPNLSGQSIIVFIDQEQPDAVVVDADGVALAWSITSSTVTAPCSSSTAVCGRRIPNAYYNKRAECWMLMRDWLKAGAEIPDDP